jgi:hypothetical protein
MYFDYIKKVVFTNLLVFFFEGKSIDTGTEQRYRFEIFDAGLLLICLLFDFHAVLWHFLL